MTVTIEDVKFKRKLKPRKFKAKKKKRPLKRKIKRSTLVHKLDAVFSEWVRVSHAKAGLVACFTCSKILPIKQIQNGHYVTRAVRSLRWDERNCRPQCFGDNVMHGGQPITFRENLIKELGEHEVLLLEAKRHELFSPSDEWLQSQIEYYRQLLTTLV